MQDRSDHEEPLLTAAGFSLSAGHFTENMGQMREETGRYYCMGDPLSVSFGTGWVAYNIRPMGNESMSTTLRIRFEGANAIEPVGLNPLPHRSNYFIGNNPDFWFTDVQNYQEILYRDLWHGIDLAYYITEQGLKYEYIVHPGADPEQISMFIEGHEQFYVDLTGALVIITRGGEVVDSNLDVFYQDEPTEKVPCTFEIQGDNGFGFRICPYDIEKILVIDPLIYSTYIGGSYHEEANDIAVDRNGSAIIVGRTKSRDFTTTDGAFQTSGFNIDAFVCKLSPDGSSFIYSTYLAGDNNDCALSIEVDDNGCAFVTGYTQSQNFPTTSEAFQTNKSGEDPNIDCFVCKLGPNGDLLNYSTYLGGEDYDITRSITVDTLGNAYITGLTQSVLFPITSNAYQNELNNRHDVFVSKLSPDGKSLLYSTYLGGEESDEGWGIEIDEDGYAYIVGGTESTNFPTTSQAFQRSLKGKEDIFISKLDTDSGDLAFSTFLGGSDYERGTSIALDNNGYLYLTGGSWSDDFPITSDAIQSSKSRFRDVIICKMTSNGTTLAYSTFIGGGDYDIAEDITLDSYNNVYITGMTGSVAFPTTPGAFQTSHSPSRYDAFITVIKTDEKGLLYSTFLGGGENDYGRGIASNSIGEIYCTGETHSIDFPITDGALRSSYEGDEGDAFVCKLNINDTVDIEPPWANAGPDQDIDQYEIVIFNGTESYDNVGIVNWTWTFSYNGSMVYLYGKSPWFVLNLTGKYSVILKVTDRTGNWAIDEMKVTVRDITNPTAIAGRDQKVELYELVTFNGTRSVDNVGITSWTWTFLDDGLLIKLNGPISSYTFNLVGVYQVTLNVTDAAGNWDIDEVNVTVLDVTDPIADAGPDRIINQHQTIMFNGSGSYDNVGIINQTWIFEYSGLTVLLYGSTPSYTFDYPGSYSVELQVFDACGNQGTDVVTVIVRDITPPVANAGPDQTIGLHSEVTFDCTGSTDNIGIVFWAWTFVYDSENIILQDPAPHFTFKALGIYPVMLSVSDSAGNWDTDLVVIKVVDTTNPIADGGPDIVINQNQMVIFNGTNSSDNIGIVIWTWTFNYQGKEWSLEGPVQEFIFLVAGEYIVTITVADGSGNKDTDTLSVNVKSVPENGDDVDVRAGQSKWLIVFGLITLVILGLILVFHKYWKKRGLIDPRDELKGKSV